MKPKQLSLDAILSSGLPLLDGQWWSSWWRCCLGHYKNFSDDDDDEWTDGHRLMVIPVIEKCISLPYDLDL